MSGESQRLREILTQRLLEHDKHGAVAVALTAITEGRISIEELYGDVLGPALIDIGNEWQRGSVAVWEEHLATAAARTIVEALYPEVERLRAERPAAGYSALMACPPEESHDLGLRMLADRMSLAGWEVFYLGPDTPLAEVTAAVRELGVDAVVLSSSTHYHRLRVREFVERLAEVLPGVAVWVGGPAFVGVAQDWPPEHLFDEAAVLAGRPQLPPSPPAGTAPDRGPGATGPSAGESAATPAVPPASTAGPASSGEPSSSQESAAHAPAVEGDEETGEAADEGTDMWAWEDGDEPEHA